jgi:hypothetical protein
MSIGYRRNKKRERAMLDFRMCRCDKPWCECGILFVAPNWWEMYEYKEHMIKRVNALFVTGKVSKAEADSVSAKIEQSPMHTKPLTVGEQPASTEEAVTGSR